MTDNDRATEEDLIKAKTCILYDDEEGFYVQASIEKVAQALAQQREGYEQRIRELEKQNKIWVELVGNLHSKIFALESAGNKLAKLARTQVNWADSEEPISNWQKAKEEGVKP